MDLSKILAISGKSGLFKIVSQTKNGLIVESIEDGKKLPVFVNDRSSALEDICVFMQDEEMPLKDVFKKIFDKENGNTPVDHKSDKNEMLKYFESVLPDYDSDRVYFSDIKKIIYWYNLLFSKDMIKFEEEEKKEKEGKKAKKDTEPEPESKLKKDKTPAKPKTTAVKTKAQKAQPAKIASAKNKGIGVKQK